MSHKVHGIRQYQTKLDHSIAQNLIEPCNAQLHSRSALKHALLTDMGTVGVVELNQGKETCNF
jgi:hypothetical protein